MLDYSRPAQALASQNGFTGVLYPVGISPKGTSADTSLHNQKSNAANLASDMVMRYEYTARHHLRDAPSTRSSSRSGCSGRTT